MISSQAVLNNNKTINIDEKVRVSLEIDSEMSKQVNLENEDDVHESDDGCSGSSNSSSSRSSSSGSVGLRVGGNGGATADYFNEENDNDNDFNNVNQFLYQVEDDDSSLLNNKNEQIISSADFNTNNGIVLNSG